MDPETAALLIQVAITLVKNEPAIYAAISADIAALSGGTMTADDLQVKWDAQRVAWEVARDKWNNA